ncbi:MAG TPA: response regulator [Candidatus Acidoferrum sp.]|jgi:DNA-binding NtrC family response regulator|nr:response regulator [Candidatus Acidoferrum sp.]
MPLERSVVSPSLARVLVVEDEARVAAVLRDALTDLGYAVKIAGNGAEALGLVPVYQPDVVLLDLAMPGIPGEDVLKRLRQAHPHLPVVVVTGNLDADVARGTLTTGAFDYVSKPFDLEQLGRIVAAAVVYRS